MHWYVPLRSLIHKATDDGREDTAGYISNAEISKIILEAKSVEGYWDTTSNSDIVIYDGKRLVDLESYAFNHGNTSADH